MALFGTRGFELCTGRGKAARAEFYDRVGERPRYIADRDQAQRGPSHTARNNRSSDPIATGIPRQSIPSSRASPKANGARPRFPRRHREPRVERAPEADIDGPLVAVVGLYPTSVSAASCRRCPSRQHSIFALSFYWRCAVASPNKTTNDPVDLPPPGPKKRNPQELDKMLDEALEDSMIASDPPAVTQPDVKLRPPKAKRQKRN